MGNCISTLKSWYQYLIILLSVFHHLTFLPSVIFSALAWCSFSSFCDGHLLGCVNFILVLSVFPISLLIWFSSSVQSMSIFWIFNRIFAGSSTGSLNITIYINIFLFYFTWNRFPISQSQPVTDQKNWNKTFPLHKEELAIYIYIILCWRCLAEGCSCRCTILQRNFSSSIWRWSIIRSTCMTLI